MGFGSRFGLCAGRTLRRQAFSPTKPQLPLGDFALPWPERLGQPHPRTRHHASLWFRPRFVRHRLAGSDGLHTRTPLVSPNENPLGPLRCRFGGSVVAAVFPRKRFTCCGLVVAASALGAGYGFLCFICRCRGACRLDEPSRASNSLG